MIADVSLNQGAPPLHREGAARHVGLGAIAGSFVRRAILISLLWSGTVAAGSAQMAGTEATPPPLTVERSNPIETPSREYSALPVGGWLLYPSVFVGAVFDDNVAQSGTSRVSSTGLRVVPSLAAETNDGIHRTVVYGTLDGRLENVASSNSVAARAGFSHRYEAATDLIVTVQGDFTRQRDLIGTFGLDHASPIPDGNALTIAPIANLQSYNQYGGSASIQKTFDQTFLSLSASAIGVAYDDAGIGPQSPSGAVHTLTARGGRWVVPFLYAFAEASIDQRRYAIDTLNSHGYRTVGGIGSEQIGLFRGEIYGGYQSQQYDLAGLGSVGAGVIGGRLYYSPTRALTLRASVDQSLGAGVLASASTTPAGTSTRVTTALLQANYAIAPEWSVSGRFGRFRTEYVGDTRLDDAWTAGATIDYSVWRNFGVTLDYQFTDVSSNVLLQNFRRNVLSLGVTYRY